MKLHKLLQFILFFYICNAEILLLNSNTFDSTLKSYPIAMVNFYADWCHFCRALSPIYDQSATILDKEIKEKKLLLAKVDCVDQTLLASRFGINKYPTLKIFHYGIPAHNEYRGERSADSIVASMKKLAEPQYTVIPTTKNIDVIPEFKTVFHGLVKDNKSPNFQIFSKIASIMSGYSLFYLSYDPKAIEEIRFMDKSKVKELLKLAGQNSDTVLEWVRARAIPFVRELTFTNAEEITEEGKPLVVFFYTPNDIKTKKIFTEMVSKQLIDIQTVNFLTADGNTFIHPLRHLSKTIEDLPLIVIDSFQHMYIYKESIPQTLEDPKPLREFISDLKSGKLHREYHYGPDPTQTKTPKKSIFKELAPNENRYSVKDEF